MERRAKQVIVMRNDLNMRKGKMVAQGAHASMKVILDNMQLLQPSDKTVNVTTVENGKVSRRLLIYDDDSALKNWIDGIFTKICLYVSSESELEQIYNEAKEAGILCSLIEDVGLTEFNGVKTKTCCAIGPEWSEKIDKITGHLKTL